jgi:hypothetical protein
MKNDPTYLHHICDAIGKIIEYTSSLSYEDFMNDEKTKDAVVRNFEIIGEASKNISSETKDSHPEIPWRYMAGMRDRLVHAYFGVDYGILWQVAREELPKIMKTLEPLLR